MDFPLTVFPASWSCARACPGYCALRRVLRTFLSKRKPVLQIGCGTSNIQEGMARAGWTVVNVSP
jgi:2-polyprenyl-3-methyl-5-hydroxy-6-metoxy-1,4-benzoquinol methylase